MKIQRLITLTIGCLLLFGARAGNELEKGTPKTPARANTLVGAYYRGDGLGMNISLILKKDGKYTAEWHGCLGKYGEASGTWRLSEKRISFTASKEEGMTKGYLGSLDVMRFKGDWILVPTEKSDREWYEESGVSRVSCFQKREKIK